MTRLLVLCTFLILSASFASGADFYIDPIHGDPSNDGSAASPWKSLQSVIDAGLIETQTWDALPYGSERNLVPKSAGAPIKPGDTIYLRTGDHGDVSIRRMYNKGVITIAAEEGHTPRLRSLTVQSGSNWAFKGLLLSPEYGDGKPVATMIDLDSHGFGGPVSNVLIEQCALQSVDDTSDWTKEDWNALACNGILADGNGIVIRDNRMKNVNFGISTNGRGALVERNTITNFSGDGLRALGDYSVFQYNTVKNCYDVNGNHDDGFQSWSSGPNGVGSGEVVGVVLRGNTIINYEDANQPHRGALQGIGCFDGMFVDWTIENNVIIVDHYHGITLLGARDCRIVNNTVLDPNDVRPGPAAIRIAKHKRGEVASGCTVRNNLSTGLSIDGEQMAVDHNLATDAPNSIVANLSQRDVRLLDDSPAIDAGSDEDAPKRDITGAARPQGHGVDIGAYESPAN